VCGDVRAPDLGIERAEADRLRDGLTHIVSSYGSVDWRSGPTEAMETHLDGIRNVIAFAAGSPQPPRLVHVSSVLVFGRSTRPVGNRDLDVGQRFHNWYEYGKFMAEQAIHQECGTPWHVVRLGPVLGTSGPVDPSPLDGLPATLPFLLRGYPVHLDNGGAFPCYVTDSRAAAEIIWRAATATESGVTWTWYDPALPTLAEVLTALCAPWNVVPRLVRLELLDRLADLAGPRLGLPRPLLRYAREWARVEPSVLEELPGPLPEADPDYCHATGEMFKRTGLQVRR
jgi:nucleoside-diphosphate-sugar epimerase